jgi:archaellum component FlaC
MNKEITRLSKRIREMEKEKEQIALELNILYDRYENLERVRSLYESRVWKIIEKERGRLK